MAKEVTLKDYQSMVQRRMDNLNDEDRETLLLSLVRGDVNHRNAS